MKLKLNEHSDDSIAIDDDEEKPYWVRTDVSGDVGTSRMLLLHSIPAALGAEIIGPISREDKKAFELSQLMQNEYLVALFPLAGGEVSQRGVVATEGTLRPSGRYTGGVPQFNVPRYSQRTLKISIYFAYFLFLLCGVGFQIQFSSITSAIIYFQHLYGPSIFRIFVAAFNIPLLPILLLQLKYDRRLDRLLGSSIAFRIRIYGSMLICTAALYGIPWLGQPLPLITGLVCWMGIFNAVGTGAYFALVSQFPIKTPIFWAVGQRLSTGLILGFQFLLIRPSLSEDSENMYYFFCCATVSFLGVVFAYILMNLPVTEYQLIARDEQIMAAKYPDSRANKVSKFQLLKVVWPTTLAGALILFSDIAVTSVFTYFPSETSNENLPLILLYISYFSDFAGRQLVLLPFQLVWNQPSELIAALLRFLFVPASLAYIKIDCFRSDWALYVFVGVFSVMGGYIRTMVFTIGPQVVHLGQRAEVSLILNLGDRKSVV